MTALKGISACGGVAAGRISVFKRKNLEIQYVRTENSAAELERVTAALSLSVFQLREIYRTTLAEAGEAAAQIFEIHALLLEDEDYNQCIEDIITTERVNAEYAVSVAADRFAELFSALDDPYMRERAADIRDISERLIRNLTSCEAAQQEEFDNMIICADDLAPSETVTLDKKRVAAFVTAKGSVNSHTAILARSMNIPAVVGVGEELFAQLSDGTAAMVDGFTGELFISHDVETAERLAKKQAEDMEQRRLLSEFKGRESVTPDGRRIEIFANIGSADDVACAVENDAEGIGLFRSEFLYLGRSGLPTEEEQFLQYKRVLERMGGKRVIIRTLDIGADKQADYLNLPHEENPALGLRGIRLCLSRPDIFKVQLRALYRASVYGRLGIMFPMITSAWEVEKILSLCSEVKQQLTNEGIPFSDSVETGIMIETPAAAIISDRLAPLVDFFSIGTNDLTQYTLACDRQNSDIGEFCDPHHKAVLRLIELAADNARRNGIRIGICGELAADTSLTERFIDIGIDELSVSPALVLNVRSRVCGVKTRNLGN